MNNILFGVVAFLMIGMSEPSNAYVSTLDLNLCAKSIADLYTVSPKSFTNINPILQNIENNCDSGLYKMTAYVVAYQSANIDVSQKASIQEKIRTLIDELQRVHHKGLDGCNFNEPKPSADKITNCQNRIYNDPRIKYIVKYSNVSKYSDINLTDSVSNKFVTMYNQLIDAYNNKICLSQNCGIFIAKLLSDSRFSDRQKEAARLTVVFFDQNRNIQSMAANDAQKNAAMDIYALINKKKLTIDDVCAKLKTMSSSEKEFSGIKLSNKCG